MIIGNPIALGAGGGSGLNIDFGATAPADTTKLWVPLAGKPEHTEVGAVAQYGDEYLESTGIALWNKRPSTQIGTKVYSFSGNSYYTSWNLTVYSYDLATGVSDSFSIAMKGSGGIDKESSAFAVGEDKVYLYGRLRSETDDEGDDYFEITNQGYIVDLVNKTVSDAPTLSDSNNCYLGGAVIGTDLYVVGGTKNLGSSGSYSYKIDCINTLTNTRTSFSVGDKRAGCAVAAVGTDLYILGGIYGSDKSYSMKDDVKKFDTLTKTVTAVNTSYTGWYGSGVAVYGQYIYTFSGHRRSGNYATDYGYSYIQKFDTVNNTVEVLEITMPSTGLYSAAVMGNEIYLYNCSSTTAVYKFTVESALTKNHLFIQADFGYDGTLFPIVNGKNEQVKAHLVNAYLGDESGIARLTPAYIHNGTGWVSLDGISYSADMLAALNILGVS